MVSKITHDFCLSTNTPTHSLITNRIIQVEELFIKKRGLRARTYKNYPLINCNRKSYVVFGLEDLEIKGFDEEQLLV